KESSHARRARQIVPLGVFPGSVSFDSVFAGEVGLPEVSLVLAPLLRDRHFAFFFVGTDDFDLKLRVRNVLAVLAANPDCDRYALIRAAGNTPLLELDPNAAVDVLLLGRVKHELLPKALICRQRLGLAPPGSIGRVTAKDHDSASLRYRHKHRLHLVSGFG